MGGVREVALLFLASLVVVGFSVPPSAAVLDQGSPGDYLVGPDVVGVELGVREAGSTVATEVSWERTIGSGDTLSVSLVWGEVGGVQGIPPTNDFTITVLRDGEHISASPFKRSGDGTFQHPFSDPGDYTITLAGLQGVTKYTMEIMET